jgi:hypothetical protein
MQEGQQPNEPGWVFRPGDINTQAGSNQNPQPPQDELVSLPEVAPEVEISEDAAPAPDEEPALAPTPQLSSAHVEWTASEYIANPKGFGWFALLAVGSVVLAIVVYLVSRDVIATAVIGVLGVIVAIFAARQPQVLSYKIDNTGLHIGQKFYPYAGFKAFSVANEHAIGFIQLLPLKRFMPPLVIHYAPEDEDRIAEVLAAYLPYEEHKVDRVDNLTRRLRF